MGYYTRVAGEIAITPPLTWREIGGSDYDPYRPDKPDSDVKLRTETDTITTDEGRLEREWAPALVPAWDDSFKAYALLEHVQAAINAFPGHTFTGRFDCEGEDADDLGRVVVRDGRAVKVVPRIVWPDEDGAP
ncbi:DUF6205 family protein [Streptomyces synnematoformans]|uniref:Uncharacterized protein n=1 Tax=Streptomyces synnematoformans TaxID=415721 RepID=A0ABP5IW95_9ACTN